MTEKNNTRPLKGKGKPRKRGREGKKGYLENEETGKGGDEGKLSNPDNPREEQPRNTGEGRRGTEKTLKGQQKNRKK